MKELPPPPETKGAPKALSINSLFPSFPSLFSLPFFTSSSFLAPSIRFLSVALLLLLGSGAYQVAEAQYFGRNKVQYREFDFRVMRTTHFDVYYYPEEERAARDAARMAERWYARLSQILDYEFDERQPLILYANHPDFQQTSVLGGSIGEGTGGVTEAFKQRVIMPFAYSYEETDHVLGHELVHAFQYDISGLGRAGGGIEAAARRFQVPLWFVEGMAEYLSVGPIDPHTSMWLRDAALQGDIPSIERMTHDPRVFPYRWGQALWAYVGGRWGDAAIGQILRMTGDGVPYPESFERVLGLSLEEISLDWHTAIRRAYLPMLAERPEAREVAHPLITQEGEGGRLNVGAVLSPDGRWVAFLSEMDFVDVELFLADARTGEVVRRLQKGTAFDPHFGSLRYISSAGSFSPDTKHFVFSALREGHDVLVILDVERGRRIKEVPIDGVGEILNPVWSPDGRHIAFSGLSGGIVDLYEFEIESEQVAKLTDDPYTELHAAYSPDGGRIAFVTERGEGTDLERLVYGPYRLAVWERNAPSEANKITLLGGVAGSKNINPQWSSDGESLFFISNRGGIPNIFRMSLATEEVYQITRLFGGVSGITDISPALSVARGSPLLVFGTYEDGEYNVYSLEGEEELAGNLYVPTPAEEARLAAMLPPVPRPSEAPFNRVARAISDPDTGLPSSEVASGFEIVPYRPRISLDYLGQPTVGAQVGGVFGGGLYGGISGLFSDVLGRHHLFGAFQLQGQLDEVGFAAQYLNTEGRWSYGGGLQRVPTVYGFYSFGEDEIEGVPVATQDLVRARIFETSAQGFALYPFSRVQRVEVGGGYRRISSDAQVFRLMFDPETGQFLGDRTFDLDGFSFNLGEVSAALVYDNSLMGYTSPFAGQRYRLQLSPTIGDIQFVDALADYRKYFFLRPFTLAFQGLHQGRYGRDSEGEIEGRQIFYDRYLGQPWYVRGYSDAFSDCREDGAEVACNTLSQLFGSRVAVAKAEVRFPLIRQLVVGQSVGFPPIEGFAFFDAGVAWDRNTEPVFSRGIQDLPGERGILTSAGVGARINVLGFLVVEVDYLKAFEMDNSWKWQVNLLPGF